MLTLAALDERCNAVVAATEEMNKSEDGNVQPIVEALTDLVKAAGPDFEAESTQLVNIVDAIYSDESVVNKSDVVYDTLVEYRDAVLAKADIADELKSDEEVEKSDQAADPEIDVMLGALGKSVMSILNVKEGNREELLNKSFGQFADAVNGYIGNIAQDSFESGLNHDITKMDDQGGLAKGMNHVAGFALLLRQVEYFLETWANEVEEESAEGEQHAQEQAGGTSAAPPKGLVAAAQWYQLGQEVLKILVQNATGEEAGGEDAGDQGDDDQGGEEYEAEDEGAEGQGGNQPDGDEGEEEEPPPPPARQAPQGQAEQPKKRPPFGKSDEANDLKKSNNQEDDEMASGALQRLTEKLEKMEAENNALRKRVEEIASKPAPAKGVVAAPAKNRDNALGKSDSEEDLQKKAEELSKMSPDERALELMKMAQRVPVPVNLQSRL